MAQGKNWKNLFGTRVLKSLRTVVCTVGPNPCFRISTYPRVLAHNQEGKENPNSSIFAMKHRKPYQSHQSLGLISLDLPLNQPVWQGFLLATQITIEQACVVASMAEQVIVSGRTISCPRGLVGGASDHKTLFNAKRDQVTVIGYPATRVF